MFVAYTVCETGHRWFADLSGICLSYDPKLIQKIIDDRAGCAKRNKEQVEEMERKLTEVKQQMNLSPIVEMIQHRNREVLSEQLREQKRIVLAEAVLNDVLIREVRFYTDIKDAIAYSVGAS